MTEHDGPTTPAPAGARTAELAPEEQHLGHGLRVRHLTMMGLGSAIGAGLFIGTGQGIAIAGPAILASYAIAGLLIVLVMRMLAELAAALPSSGSFSTYAEAGIGRWAGFTLGWVYWFTLIMVLGVEITASSAIIHSWVALPQWLIAVVLVVGFAAVNLAGVRSFGEFEYWFAALKVGVIVVFLVVGVLLVLGVLPDRDPVGLTNLLGHGGFAPQGLAGIAAGLLVVVFAFGGIEIITIAAAESDDPQRSIARAARTIVWRILLFYVGSVAIMVLVLPWTSPELVGGPFVAVLGEAGIPGLAAIMEVVVVVALLSAFNANVYGTSRMAFSLAERGDGPPVLTAVSRRGVPWVAVVVSVVFALVSVLLNWLLPETLLGILLSAVGASLLVIWIAIAVSQLRLRPRLEATGRPLTVRMWAFPSLTWFTLALLGGIVLLMLTDDAARRQALATTVLVAGVAGIYAVRERLRRRRPAVA
ncbi:amino acid permease [Cellulomonas carbonis]|uniref:Amino acid transporter n=1 Tax=Cellulomonas carbonis T26 TaxID=947969 RepID=A0A0A0BT57_9CELL|nr:amino acid permease [Cellulomonas carbonis]KGM10324.1 amino acid transporter [Cellulomonas carbonis T26]GGC00154.1 aromatic amino acid transport protein AroP [Cellulomonas carbonis]